jgi:hypothetical protein
MTASLLLPSTRRSRSSMNLKAVSSVHLQVTDEAPPEAPGLGRRGGSVWTFALGAASTLGRPHDRSWSRDHAIGEVG